ncbi:MAG: aminotransferase class I/II-fold pyridoxal phosphate-dependent enzyme, partial [Pseudomonadota bacterium]|nr:aminotransferase class I/II-fold pyridoxal phosphate-dependent enzyme [Pseudomonadota bacterium]
MTKIQSQSTSNPTGVAYTRAELAALGEVLRRYPQVIIATDDMYEHILWAAEPFSNILNVCPDLYDRTIVLNGVSKAYSMTGWRIGYAAGPLPLLKAMTKIQSQSTSNPTSISQVAAQAALSGDQSCISHMLKAFKERHDYLVAALNSIHDVRCIESQGTFYAFPSMHGVINSHPEAEDDVALSDFLLNEAEVALVPGSAFGAPGYVRLSYATSMENLQTAIQRIKKVLGSS